jgi:hypothetical protein
MFHRKGQASFNQFKQHLQIKEKSHEKNFHQDLCICSFFYFSALFHGSDASAQRQNGLSPSD